MFGDWSWNGRRTDLQRRRFSGWLKEVATLNMAVVEMGAGNAVSTVRGLSEQVTRSHNATLIRINPRDYMVPHERDISLPLGAAEAVGAIVEHMKESS